MGDILLRDAKSNEASIAVAQLDDAGELDYEPSEQSANSIKDAASDYEDNELVDADVDQRNFDDGELCGDSQKDRFTCKKQYHQIKSAGDDEGEFSGPEEGEVDELEEGEVKEESDDDKSPKRRRVSTQEPEEGEEIDDASPQQQFVMKKHISLMDSFKTHQQQMLQNQHPLQLKPKVLSVEQQKQRSLITAPLASQPTTMDMRPKNAQGDIRPEDMGICKFFIRGQCTWGSFCKFLHPTGGKKESDAAPETIVLMSERRPFMEASAPSVIPVPLLALRTDPPTLASSTVTPTPKPQQMSESAWERGLKQMRERIKKASEKKEIDPDFEHKRLTMPVGPEVMVEKSPNDTPTAAHQSISVPSSGPKPPIAGLGRPNDRFTDDRPQFRSQSINHGGGTIRDLQYENFDPMEMRLTDNTTGYYDRRPAPMRMTGGDAYRRLQAQPMQQQIHQHQHLNRPVDDPPLNFRANVSDSVVTNALPKDRQYAVPQQQTRERLGSHSPAHGTKFNRGMPHSSAPQNYYLPQDSANRKAGGRTADPDERDFHRRREFDHSSDRRSPPSYYRELKQSQAAGRRNYEAERYDRDTDDRRPSRYQQEPPRSPYGRSSGRNADDSFARRSGNSSYEEPRKRDHYRDRSEKRPEREERESERDRDQRHRDSTRSRNDYNISNKTRPQQSSGRQLPYERPPYVKPDSRYQWRDPWRRSPSPSNRRQAGQTSTARTQPARSSRNNSPIDSHRSQRRNSSCSSSSGSSSPSSRSSISSARGGDVRDSQETAGKTHRRSRQDSENYGGRHSPLSSHSSGSDVGTMRKNGRRGTADHTADSGAKEPSEKLRDHEQQHLRDDSRDSSPRAGNQRFEPNNSGNSGRVPSKLYSQRSFSPRDDSGRRSDAENSGARSSASSGRLNGAKDEDRRQKWRNRSSTPPIDRQEGTTRPLSPPPPAPFLGARNVSDVTEGRRSSEDLSPQQWKPIKMTIQSKAKVQSNSYDDAEEAEADEVANDQQEPVEETSSEAAYGGGPRSSHKTSSSGDDEPGDDKFTSDSQTDDRDESSPKRVKHGSSSEHSDGNASSTTSRRRAELMRQLRAVEDAIAKKRSKLK